jgi:hypothetical protein
MGVCDPGGRALPLPCINGLHRCQITLILPSLKRAIVMIITAQRVLRKRDVEQA